MFKEFDNGTILSDVPEVSRPYIRKVSVSHASAIAFSRVRGDVKDLYRSLKSENERLRRPCPTCQNLVRPELQDQHNDAYHTKRSHRI